MSKILFISNIADKVGSFSLSAVMASKDVGADFCLAANWSGATKEQMKKDEQKYGIHLYHIDLSRSPYSKNNIKSYHQLVDLINKEQFDVIHCNTPVGGLLGRLAGKKCGVKKMIYQAHGFHFYKGAPLKNWMLYYPIEKWLAHYTDALITINQEDYELARKKFRLRNNGKVYYVPGVGIDLSQYTSSKDIRGELRKKEGFKEEDIVCIAMGDLILRKNYKVAIETISRLQSDFPTLHFAICGKGPELENLKQFATEKGVLDKIHFLGFRTDIKELLQAADIFFFTSLQEGLPRSTMEAMASGLSVACSRIRGNIDLIDEAKGGVLFDPMDVDDIEKKMRQLLTSDYEFMGKYNLDHIRKFSLDAAKESITNVYIDEVNTGGGIESSVLLEFYPEWYKKRFEMGLKATDTVLISVGRLDKNKNNELIIRSVLLCDSSNIHLVICGDGDERDNLMNLVKELNLDKQVHFLGNRTDMMELYTMADIFVLASFREGLSRSIMEAMASGLPCIVSDIRGNRDLVVNGKGGYLFSPYDLSSLVNSLHNTIKNKAYRDSMGKFNSDKICDFDSTTVTKNIEKIYKEV